MKPRRRRGASLWAIIALALVVIAWLVVFQAARSNPTPDDPPTAEATAEPDAAAPPTRPEEAFPLTVLHVYDGDTIQAASAAENAVVSESGSVRIRLIGIDTPEGSPEPECWADDARAALRALLPEGSTVWAVPDEEWHDRYDRWLFYLWTDDGRFVNHELVAAGAAEALEIAPNDTYAALFAAGEERARAAGAGRWGACATG